MTQVFVDPSSNFHPYECDGPGKCQHCDHTRTPTHDPDECWLCHDGPPPSWEQIEGTHDTAP